MENEEKSPIPQESAAEGFTADVSAPAGSDIPAEDDTPIASDSPSETDAPAAQEPSEKSSEPSPTISEQVLPDGSRVIVIPKGYEHYPDGWYPKNPIRRFMERWGSFLNLGLILIMLTAVLLTSVPPATPSASPQAPTEATVQAPAETEEPVPEVSGDASLPTVPAISVPAQTECFTLKDGVLDFVPEKFDPCPILQIPDTLNGETVISIAAGAFENLDGVTTVILPSGLRVIGDRSFAGCPDLRGVYLSDTVRSIGKEAFEGCVNLESIFIPSVMHSIGADAFENCAAMRYIFYNGTFDDWQNLYSSYITPFTFVLCTDGDFPHAAEFPLG